MERESSLPPQPPDVDRRISVTFGQFVSMIFIFILPVLAITGMLGPAAKEIRTSGPDVEIHIDYPALTRHNLLSTIYISLTNTSGNTLSGLKAGFDRSYFDHVSQVIFTPDVSEITHYEYAVYFPDIQAGESRRIIIEFEPKRMGYHQGRVSISTDETGQAEIPYRTFVWP